VTEAGGKVAASTSRIGTADGTCADTVDTRCHTPGAGFTASSSGTVTDPVTATRPRSFRTRSTIMMFSATSLAEARSRAGSAARGRVPLIGLDVTVSPERRRNNSGDSDATAPQPPARYAARAGAVAVTASAKKSSVDPVARPVNWVHTQAWYTSPAEIAARQASTPVRCAARSGAVQSMRQDRGGVVAPSAAGNQSGISAPVRDSYHHIPSAARRSTLSVQPPVARGIRAPAPSG